jgi:hypothetical protein
MTEERKIKTFQVRLTAGFELLITASEVFWTGTVHEFRDDKGVAVAAFLPNALLGYWDTSAGKERK